VPHCKRWCPALRFGAECGLRGSCDARVWPKGVSSMLGSKAGCYSLVGQLTVFARACLFQSRLKGSRARKGAPSLGPKPWCDQAPWALRSR